MRKYTLSYLQNLLCFSTPFLKNSHSNCRCYFLQLSNGYAKNIMKRTFFSILFTSLFINNYAAISVINENNDYASINHSVETNVIFSSANTTNKSFYMADIVSAPLAASVQIYASNATIANLVAAGGNLRWYDVAIGGTELPLTTALVDNVTYYVSQTVGGVESTRTAVLAKRISEVSQNFCGSATVANFVTAPVSNAKVNWYTTATGGEALASNTPLVSGNYYVEMEKTGSDFNIVKTNLQVPVGITTGDKGSIFFASLGGSSVQKMNSDGSNLVTLISGLSYPIGVSIDNMSNIWFAEYLGTSVGKITADGSNTIKYSNGLRQPYRVIVAPNGKVLIAEPSEGSVKQMNADGTDLQILKSNLGNIYDIQFLKDQKIIVTTDDGIFKMDANGDNLSKISNVETIYALAVDHQGRIVYIANGGLYRMNTDGLNVETLLTGLGLSLGIAIEDNGNILITDANNNRILRVESYITNRVLVSVSVNSQPGANNIIYVDANVSGGTGKGNSWGNAQKSLSDALKCARQQNDFIAANPLKIYVARGTYYPQYNAKDDKFTINDDRNNSFVLVKNVQLFGGFDPVNAINDLTKNRVFGDGGSVLSGDLGIKNNNSDDAYHVVVASGDLQHALMDGFTITKGNANGGGGVSSSISVNNNVIYNDYAGGIYTVNSSPNFLNLNINNNKAKSGAGIFNSGSSPLVRNSIIKDNNADDQGGGIYNENLSTLTVANSIINGNKAISKGGAISDNDSSSKIYNTIIWGNTALGLYADVYTQGNMVIKHSITQEYNTSQSADNNLVGVDPLFVNATVGDYRLRANSPAIDKGNNSFYITNGGSITDKDLGNSFRFSHCDIDIGVYEFQNGEDSFWTSSAWLDGFRPNQNRNACIESPYNIPNDFTANNIKIKPSGSLSIQPNHSVTVYGNITQAADNQIVLEIDASLLQINNNSINSNHKVTVKRGVKMRKMDYTYWGTPVSGQKLLNDTAINDGFSVGTPNGRIWEYNEPNDYFKASTDNYFVPGKAYAIRGKDSFDDNALSSSTYRYVGTANNGRYFVDVQKSKNTIVQGVEYEHGYNLIGNPYPSNIDFEAFYNLENNKNYIAAKAWFWTNSAPHINQSGSGYNGNNYATITLTGGVPPTTTQPDAGLTPTQFIKVGQGFIVQVKDPSSLISPLVKHSLTFDNSIRSNNTGVFYNAKNAKTKDRFWLELISPQGFTNTILIGYIPGATNQYDVDYDAEIMVIGDDALYTKQNGSRLQIEGRQYPLSKQDMLPLGTRFADAGIYKIHLRNPEGVFNQTQDIYLKDKLLNKTINLSEVENYSFQAVKGVEDNRFEIVYKPEAYLTTEATNKNQIKVYKTEHDFVVFSNTKKIQKLELYDVNGRLLSINQNEGKEMKINHEVLSNAVYLLKIYQEGELFIKKVIK